MAAARPSLVCLRCAPAMRNALRGIFSSRCERPGHCGRSWESASAQIHERRIRDSAKRLNNRSAPTPSSRPRTTDQGQRRSRARTKDSGKAAQGLRTKDSGAAAQGLRTAPKAKQTPRSGTGRNIQNSKFKIQHSTFKIQNSTFSQAVWRRYPCGRLVG